MAGQIVAPEGKQTGLLARIKKPRPLPTRRRLMIMILAIFFVMFLVGWNDASQGPLLPLLQTFYSVNYTVISIIWIATAVGVMTAAVSNVFLADILGFGILTPLGAFAQAFAYCLMCWGSPYPLFVIAYFFIGLGLGWQDAQVNSMASRMPNNTVVMFMAHAIYGLGATVSPFVSTAFLQQAPDVFYYFFIVSLGLAIVTLVTLIVVYQGRTEDQVVGKARWVGGQQIGMEKEATSSPTVPLPDAGAGMVAQQEHLRADEEASVERNQHTPSSKEAKEERSGATKLRAIFTSPRALCMAFYIFAYMGIEVTIGGWATTFLLTERGGDDNSGYVTSGYFGGLTIGRIILIPVTNWLGHRPSVFYYSAICLALHFVIWFVDSLIGSAVCFALIGVFMGPMYPSCVLLITELMPGDLHTGAIGMLACLGVVGSAIMPFITGALSEAYDVWVLNPVLIALWVVSLGLWTAVSRFKKVVHEA